MTVKDIDLVSTEELAEMDAQTSYTSPIFGSYASDVEMPETKLNKMPIEPRIASEMIREYIGTEGNAHQNLCTFVQTYMEPEAAELMKDTLEKNAIDKDEYPMTADLENRCVKIIQNLWHADQDEQPMGTSTVGSSEACMLGGLAALFRWKALAKKAGIDIYSDHRPNLETYTIQRTHLILADRIDFIQVFDINNALARFPFIFCFRFLQGSPSFPKTVHVLLHKLPDNTYSTLRVPYNRFNIFK